MALLKIKARSKIYITWGSSNIYYIRSIDSIKDILITYTSALGQTYTAGQVLYTEGTISTVGYLKVTSTNNVTLSGSGNFNISVENYSSASQGNRAITFNIDESAVTLNLFYNSNPIASDIIVETANRTPYIFSTSDFITNYTDFDSNSLAQVQINGDLTGFTLGGTTLVSGTWIPISYVTSSQLIYTTNDTSEYYEKDVTWKAKDSQGNISIT